MFSHHYVHNLDTKSRLIVPAKYRAELGSTFMLIRSVDGCLAAFPMSEWASVERKLLEMKAKGDKKSQATSRYIMHFADECEVDSIGRFCLSKDAKEYAGITKEVILAGNINMVEIWDKTRWEDYQANIDPKEIFEDIGFGF